MSAPPGILESLAGRPVPESDRERRSLSGRWRLARAPAGSHQSPPGADELEWIEAAVPGTVAGALLAAGSPCVDLDEADWWFRRDVETGPLAPGEEVLLVLDGLATVSDVYLNGELVAHGDSMFVARAIEVGDRLRPDNEVAICFRALAPLLSPRRRPRARWRTKLVSDGNLRFFRTMLLGRTPGFAPGPPVIGPWREISLLRRGSPWLHDLKMHARMAGGDGAVEIDVGLGDAHAIDELAVCARVTGPGGFTLELLELRPSGEDGARATGTVVVPDVVPWWPHTHGRPIRYEVKIEVARGGEPVAQATRMVGFRTLTAGADLERDGIQIEVNGARVFARGAVWTPPDLTAPETGEEDLRRVLAQVVATGMNMLRIPGIGCYEGDAFYDLCDELGILVWQDFMFANMDYPEQDAEFMQAVEREGRQILDRVGWRPSLTVLCGGSEVAQQAAMLGLGLEVSSGPLYGELLPRLIAESGTPAAYVPSAPWGGDLPFRPDRGVANYYGVGAYLRPLEDARRAEVKFAAECLAFANVPYSYPDEPIGGDGLGPQRPEWKAGVPHDVGTGWDFEDVRDHYLQLLFGVDPVRLRGIDIDRYLDLSRIVSGEVMAEVFGEWRRRRSPCGGSLVLWLTDLLPGAGWGLLDHRARPKLALHYLRRALAPVAVWSTDEGLGGIVAHIANDTAEPLSATLRVGLYRDHELAVAQASTPVKLAPHAQCEHNVEMLLGHFADVSWSYGFGPPAHDLVVLSLERPGAGLTEPLSQAFRLPAVRPSARESVSSLGLFAEVDRRDDETWMLRLGSRRFVYGCRVEVPGFLADDDGFSLEPGHPRVVALRAVGSVSRPEGEVSAVNLNGRIRIGSQ